MARRLDWSLSALAALLSSLWLALCAIQFKVVHAAELPRPRLIQGQCIGKWRTTHGSGHLAELPSETHSPDSPLWNNSVAICALMKSENSTDVREWLLYYKYASLACLLHPYWPVWQCLNCPAGTEQGQSNIIAQHCHRCCLSCQVCRLH